MISSVFSVPPWKPFRTTGGIGLLFAVFADLRAFEIGGYPVMDTLILAIHDVALWTVVGLATGWILRASPDGESRS